MTSRSRRRPLAAAAAAPCRLGCRCLWDLARVGSYAIDRREQFLPLLRERADDAREAALAFACQTNPRTPAILIAGLADEETGVLGTADGAGDCVRFDAQPFGDVVDGGPFIAGGSALDHQKQQIALRRQTGGPRGLFGGVFERSEGGAEAGDRDVVGLLFGSSHYEVNNSYYEVIPQ
jgi:hypothetical protein